MEDISLLPKWNRQDVLRNLEKNPLDQKTMKSKLQLIDKILDSNESSIKFYKKIQEKIEQDFFENAKQNWQFETLPTQKQTKLQIDDFQEPEQHKKWRSEILEGIVNLLKLDRVPGKSIVFGNNAAAILVGDTASDVLISAAELGKGRVVLISHDGYLNDFTSTNTDESIARLHKNVKKWVTKNNFTTNTDFTTSQLFAKSTSAQSYLGLYSIDDLKEYTQVEKTKILTFVKNGGGLVVARCPWGWAQLKGTNDFSQMLNYKTLLEAGMALTVRTIEDSVNFDCLKQNLDNSHMKIQLGKILSPQKADVNYAQLNSIMALMKYLPETQKAKIRQRVLSKIPYSQISSNAPTLSTPVTSDYIKCRLSLYQHTVLDAGLPNIVAPGYDQFPGKVDTSNPTFQYHHNVPFTFTAPGYEEYHHTGFYAVAGKTVTINVVGDVPTPLWQVFIGFHYDNDQDHEKWIRWPTVSISAQLNSSTIKITSPYGGLVVLRNPYKSKAILHITISNLVEVPFYDSQNQASVADWNRRKITPGAWGCVVGKYTSISFPRHSFVNLQDPSKIMKLYDEIVLAYHNLRGTDPLKQRKQCAVADIDPVVGYMHSGFPLVTQLDVADPENPVFMFNYENAIKKGGWGYFHEMGHNVQRDWWTYEGTVEVTCNIFSLKATEIATGVRPKQAPWFMYQKNRIKQYLKSPKFSKWQADPGIGLGIYVQMIEDFGWQTLQRVFTSYENGDTKTYPTDIQGKIDFFWSMYSIEAGVNLQPLLIKWGIPFTEKFISEVKSLPPYEEKVNILS